MKLAPTYDPSLVSSLSDIENRIEGGRYSEHLLELGDLIIAHGLASTVGVALLHRHYTLTPSERLTRVFTSHGINTRAEAYRGQDLLPCIWRLNSRTSPPVFSPIEFVAITLTTEHIRADVLRIGSSAEFLAEAAELIQVLAIADVFGLASLAAWRSDGEPKASMLYEHTDHTCRTSYLTKSTPSAELLTSAINTLWAFESGSASLGVGCPACDPKPPSDSRVLSVPLVACSACEPKPPTRAAVAVPTALVACSACEPKPPALAALSIVPTVACMGCRHDLPTTTGSAPFHS
jgi:hypothetical protein